MAQREFHPDADPLALFPYIEAVERLRLGEYDHVIPVEPPSPLGRLGHSLTELSRDLHRRYLESTRLESVAARMHAGLLLDEVLDGVYRDFRELIPYDRIGVALLEDDGRVLRARWARSEQLRILLGRGFSAPMTGSSLQEILRTGRPRILNDLHAYADARPGSVSTQLVVEEGYRSSLTCPLVANGVPIGFVFFSSTEPGTYADLHVETFLRIAGQLATVVEKARHLTQLAEQRELLERQASYMLHLPADLLDVSQIEAGRLQLSLQPLEVGILLRETLARFARSAEAKGSRLLLESAPVGSLVGDPLRLRQVLDNLTSNALKYAPAGTTVHLGATHAAGAWRLFVRDEGPGLSLADQGRLFQDFVPLTARPTGGESRTGLGLAISRRVVQAHGGRIGVDSLPGRGATFWFYIPDLSPQVPA